MGEMLAPFTGNVTDLGNENGFQWEFRCDRCGRGFQSPFEQNLMARGRGALRTMGRWFGGLAETISDGVESFNSYTVGAEQSTTKDKAFATAVEYVRPNFRQCRGCGGSVCAGHCWNDAVGQCQVCSPLVAEEMARAKGDAQRYQLREHAMQQDLIGGNSAAQQAPVNCRTCGANSSGGKFCSQCGQPMKVAVTCKACGVEASAGAVFCHECGGQL